MNFAGANFDPGMGNSWRAVGVKPVILATGLTVIGGFGSDGNEAGKDEVSGLDDEVRLLGEDMDDADDV